MSDTLDNIRLTKDSYKDINTLSGIPVGSSISLQNQSNEFMRVSIGSSQPSVDSLKYFLLKDDISVTATIPAGENRVWVYGEGYLHVEVV